MSNLTGTLLDICWNVYKTHHNNVGGYYSIADKHCLQLSINLENCSTQKIPLLPRDQTGYKSFNKFIIPAKKKHVVLKIYVIEN